MKKLSAAIIILLFLIFAVIETLERSQFKVLDVINSHTLTIDLNRNGKAENTEALCIYGIEPITLLEQEYVSKTFVENLLKDKKVKVKLLKHDEDCRFAQIYFNNEDFSKKFKQSIKTPVELAKLHLVIYNNKSGKYHTTDCPYGKVAHDKELIPARLLPKSAKPCKFCHIKKTTAQKIQPAPSIISRGNVKLFLNDFTTVMKPSNKCLTAACRALLSEINATKSTIDFAIYGYDKVPEIEGALAHAQARNVKIRFVYDLNSEGKSIYSDTLYLSKLFTANKSDLPSNLSNAIMHNKFYIFDGKRVLTGSANLSPSDVSGFSSNASLLINSTEVAKVFTREFEQMFYGKFHTEKSSNSYETSDLKVYFSPQDEAITKNIIPLINSAKTYIYMPVFLITHKNLTNAILQAKSRGVKIKVIVDATNASSAHSQHQRLRQSGIQVKVENYAGKLHSKSIIIDDKYIVVGSMNFSHSGEAKNDENVVIVKNPDLAIMYRKFFEMLWQKIPDKWLNANVRAESHASIGSCADGIDNNFDGKIDKDDVGCR